MFPAAIVTALGQATFTKITSGPLVNNPGNSCYVSWADYDADGDVDLFVPNGTFGGARVKNLLYRNDGNGSFTLITIGPIASEEVDSAVGVWGDYDNDGDLDLFVSNKVLGNDLLYQNNGGGTFTRITDSPLVRDGRYGGTGAWADVDNDGHLDFYITDYDPPSGVNRFYRNNGDGSFTRVTNHVIVADRGDWIQPDWADYDNDGLIDLFVTRNSNGQNTLYRNLGQGAFTKITTGAVVSDSSSYGCSWVDYDNDGFFDLFVSIVGYNSQLYRNNGNGTFTRVNSQMIGLNFAPGTANAWGDYDNDGFIDAFVAPIASAGLPGALYRNSGDGSFTRILTGHPVEDVGNNSRGCAWGDYDNDGFLDLFVGNGWGDFNGKELNSLYHNDGNGNAWLKVTLVGTQSNRSAIGAKVHVTANIRGGTIRQLRQVSGYNSLQPHFGLGDATSADLVRIEWPSGAVTERKNVVARQVLTVFEQPRLTATTRPGDTTKLTLRCGIGLSYALEASADLANWLPLLTNTATGLTLEFEDDTNVPHRFYRVRMTSP